FTNLSEHNQIQLLKTGYNEQGITNIIELFTNLSEHNQIQLLKTGYNEQGITNIIELVSKKQ
ncbi:hypothetical protein P4621_23695, partial [Priestia aryabhattai]|nr:hypothetical protein [Priestia aryabhattai]